MAGTDTKNSTIERTPDGTIELKITIPWSVVKKEWDLIVTGMVKTANLPGFRKGKAPKKLVEEKLDTAKIKEDALRKILPSAYIEAVREHNLKPIMDPKIHIDGALDEGKSWQLHAVTAELPEVDLTGYKEAVKKITAKSKIILPGKPASPDASQSREPEAPKFDEIVKTLLGTTKVSIPTVLVEREADTLLSQTLDEIKRLGMSLDQYLSSTGKTAEILRAEYATKAQNDLKLEFVLQKVAESEKITVDEGEIEKTIDNAKPEEKESLRANKYVLASIIRQQKTLDFLKSL